MPPSASHSGGERFKFISFISFISSTSALYIEYKIRYLDAFIVFVNSFQTTHKKIRKRLTFTLHCITSTFSNNDSDKQQKCVQYV